jgi:allantoinase
VLILPYSLDVNDFKFLTPNGFVTGDDFFQYARDSLDQLLEEGGRMMSIGLHNRSIGRPGRARGLGRFLEYVTARREVWVATRADIARHWRRVHPYQRS